MVAVYPGGLWGGNVRGTFMDDPDIHEKWHDDIQNEVKAMQAEFGLNPSGSYSTVKARLDAPPIINVYTANATWTKSLLNPAMVWIRAVGAGGAGGGAPASTAGNVSAGLPGHAGGYAERWMAASALAATVAVTVGSGGAGISGGTGSTGGDSTFGAHLSATGGGGGGTMAAAADTGTRVQLGINNAGIGTLGNINARGGYGGNGLQVVGGSLISMERGGMSAFGSGPVPALESNGTAAQSPGAGGGGMRNNGLQAARTGGAGADGLIIVVTIF